MTADSEPARPFQVGDRVETRDRCHGPLRGTIVALHPGDNLGKKVVVALDPPFETGTGIHYYVALVRALTVLELLAEIR